MDADADSRLRHGGSSLIKRYQHPSTHSLSMEALMMRSGSIVIEFSSSQSRRQSRFQVV